MCNRAIQKHITEDKSKKRKKFFVTSSCIVKKNFLRFVKGYPRQDYSPSWPSPHSTSYPKPNTYYAFAEETNPFTRIQTTCICLENEFQAHFDPPKEPFVLRDPYFEEEARKKYLESEPVSFVIFGKPGVDTKELCRMIADGWKCVLISPESLILQEIQARSEKGTYIEKILGSGRSISPEIVDNLIKNRLNMRDIRHRGYIVEGLPLIPSDPNLDHLFQPEIAELRDKLTNDYMIDDFPSVCEMILSPRSSENISKSCCKPGINPVEDIPRQIEDIFTTWPIKPRIIIYAMCPDEDLVKKYEILKTESEKDKFTDSVLTMDIAENRSQLFAEDDFYDSIKTSLGVPSDIGREDKELLLEEIRKDVKNRCELYRRLALPVIDKWLLLHNPQNVIRVDGRTSASQMFEIVSIRLRMLPLPRLLLPKELIERMDLGIEGDEDTRQITLQEEELEGMSNEDAFRTMATIECVALRFPWRLSRWRFYCPVELARGRTVEGIPKYAVQFMKNIFFLSSQEAVQLFIDNPRTFLLPPNPRPTCKIAVIGPRFSGKSELCRELAGVLKGTVINVEELENLFKNDRIDAKVNQAIREMVDDVIREVQIKLETERKIKEALKMTKLREWYEDISATIQRLNDITIHFKNIQPSDDNYCEVFKKVKSLRQKLQKHNLAHVETDNRFLQEIKKDKSILYPYAPEHLTQVEPIRELTEHDPEVSSILQDRVKHIYDEPIELSTDDKFDIIIKSIRNISDEVLDDGVNRDGGFVVDNMYMDLEVWTKILNDTNMIFEDIVIIFENDPYHNLVKKWKNFNTKYEELGENEFIENKEEMFEYESDIELENYLLHLDEFQSALGNFRDSLVESRQNMIFCDLRSVKDPKEYVIKRIKDRYEWKATVMSEEEKEQERIIIEQELIAESMKREDTRTVNEEEVMGEGDTGPAAEEIIHKDIRRLGDSDEYCPVTLSKYNVLWKGKEEFSAIFMNSIYLLSNQQALEEFFNNPWNFGIPLLEPPRVIPPLRISIIGPPGSGKSVVANALSREYGLFWVDYSKCFEKYMTSRGMKAFTLEDDIINPPRVIEEEEEEEAEVEEEVELPEDLNDVRYGYDESIIYTFIKDYIQNGRPLPRNMFRECFLNFFLHPFDKFGIVFDGFPSCSQDVEAALESRKIPEVIIELHCGLEKSLERLLPICLKLWQEKQDKAKLAEETRYNQELKNYLKKRDEWIKNIIRERFMTEEAETHEDEYEGDFYNFELDPAERAELEEIWREENVEPVLFTDWEDIETARERISRKLEEIYDEVTRKILPTREAMEGETIPWIEVDGEQDERKLILQVQRHLESYVFRDSSMFERTYTIDMQTAERLLECGYYFLSSFGRWCPVQAYQNKVSIQMFLPMEVKDEVYPVIHRQYIYFLCGQDAVSAFTKNPLKYLEQDSCLPLVPLKVSIIGPPKCGKTTLAERFAETYGLLLVSREKALQYVLNNYSWIELAKLIESHIRDGTTVSNKIMARAVEMYLIDPHTVSQGYVFDDFPNNRGESEELAFLNIRPMIVIDLKADLQFCTECLSYLNSEINVPPNFGLDHLTQLYDQWQIDQTNFRDWLKKFSQNIVEIDASNSKWSVWTQADRIIREKLAKIRRYFRESDYEKVHTLENMCVSPYEFKTRQSIYESYCPVCLLNDKSIVSSGGSIDRTGVMQFREHFYWICSKHRTDFMDNPNKFIPPENTAILPKIRPRIVDETIDLEHACWARRLQADGFCLVTYVDGLPNRNLVAGKIDLALLYDDKLYLFCSQYCQDQFLCRWLKYYDVKIHFPVNLPDIDVKDLPIIGYLEQTVAKRVIEAVNQVAVIRPKLPGLSAPVSAAIYMGVHLKIRNVSCCMTETDIYTKVRDRMEARRRIVELAVRSMKEKLNPYLIIPKSYFHEKINHTCERVRTSSRPSSIRFRRTSPTQILDDPEDSS